MFQIRFRLYQAKSRDIYLAKELIINMDQRLPMKSRNLSQLFWESGS